MLRVKAFKIDDDAGVNRLLDQFRLAKGSHILVSEGKILVPYEDGEEPTALQVINETKEERNELTGQARIIAHSQDINLQQIQEAEADVIIASEEHNKQTSNHLKKEAAEALKNAEERLAMLKATLKQNDKELARLDMNVERMDQKIEFLRKQ